MWAIDVLVELVAWKRLAASRHSARTLAATAGKNELNSPSLVN